MKALVIPIALVALGSVLKCFQRQLELLNIHYAGLILKLENSVVVLSYSYIATVFNCDWPFNLVKVEDCCTHVVLSYVS